MRSKLASSGSFRQHHGYLETLKTFCRHDVPLSSHFRYPNHLHPTCRWRVLTNDRCYSTDAHSFRSDRSSSFFVHRHWSVLPSKHDGASRVRSMSDTSSASDVIIDFQSIDAGDIATLYDWSKLEQYHVDNLIELDENRKHVHLCGYITGYRAGKKVDFFTMVDPYLQRAIQVVCPKSAIPKSFGQEHNRDGDTNKTLRPHTPILVTGLVSKSQKSPTGMQEGSNTFRTVDQYVGEVGRIGHIELQASGIKILNQVPSNLVAKHDTNFPPEKRHLQIRTGADLRAAIRMRSKVKAACTSFLLQEGFDDIETPLLFKSTPEGAREFIVPTRRSGLAYALPQSPQQYKQVLMASGVHRYFQFARCFRDEDLRADRQPEFTQLDLEMSFANRETVMSVVESLILDIVWPAAERSRRLPSDISAKALDAGSDQALDKPSLRLPLYTYEQAMSKYGSDKPDTRLGAEIVRIDAWAPLSLKKMLTDMSDPVVEMIQIKAKDQDPLKSQQFMAAFMDLPDSIQYIKGRHGMTGISIYDPTKPLCGLASFGHEAASQVETLFVPDEGDVFITQVRPNVPFSGGSTTLGSMRRDLLGFALQQGFIDTPSHDSLLWVTDFPLFTPTEEDAPGQEGGAGICSTHHPFTAPRCGQDLSKLLSNPLSVIGDHYDLVINGTEVGGGSRRIHYPQMQELIFRDVLKMTPNRIKDFGHLLGALEVGCPPHAGLALGFDRLMALLLDKTSVRDVIAFPKWGDGEDKFVGSPSQLTPSQLSTYHLKVTEGSGIVPNPTISLRA